MSIADVLSGIGAGGGSSGWARGGQAISEALTGGGQVGQAYDEAMSRGHRLQKQLMEARIKSDEMAKREQLDLTMSQAMRDNPEMAALYSTMLRAGVGGNFQQLTAGGINLTRGQALSQALEAPNQAEANRLLQVYQGRPAERTKIAGNTMYDPLAAPNEQAAVVTPYGQTYLANQHQAAMTRANRVGTRAGGSRASAADAGDKDFSDLGDRQALAMVNAAAEDAFRQARSAGLDMSGVQKGDIAYALRTQGRWQHPAGGTPVVIGDGRRGVNFRTVTGSVAPTSQAVVAETAPGRVEQVRPSDALSGAAAPRGAPVADPQRGQRAAQPPSGGLAPALDYESGGNALPPQALAQLEEGVETEFANGQVWALIGGRPVRIR